MKKLAIVTARGGSKRIPRKNIKLFLGKPIIAYSIVAALESGLFDEVMVSTDDAEIAKIAKEYGAKVPFIRSVATANDFATTADVLVEVIGQYQSYQQTFDYACCLYPTAPFITPLLLQNSFDLLIKQGFDTVFPVQEFSFPIQRSLQLNQGKLAWNFPENAQKRSQDLTRSYHDCGQFYFFKVQQFLETQQLLSNNTGGIVISELDAHDIDSETDWQMAELKFRLMTTT